MQRVGKQEQNSKSKNKHTLTPLSPPLSHPPSPSKRVAAKKFIHLIDTLIEEDLLFVQDSPQFRLEIRRTALDGEVLDIDGLLNFTKAELGKERIKELIEFLNLEVVETSMLEVWRTIPALLKRLGSLLAGTQDNVEDGGEPAIGEQQNLSEPFQGCSYGPLRKMIQCTLSYLCEAIGVHSEATSIMADSYPLLFVMVDNPGDYSSPISDDNDLNNDGKLQILLGWRSEDGDDEGDYFSTEEKTSCLLSAKTVLMELNLVKISNWQYPDSLKESE